MNEKEVEGLLVDRVSLLDLQDGDIVVLYARNATPDLAKMMNRTFAQVFPKCMCLVLDEHIKVGHVIRPGPGPLQMVSLDTLDEIERRAFESGWERATETTKWDDEHRERAFAAFRRVGA